MNDDQLRALVRAAVARHLGRPEHAASGVSPQDASNPKSQRDSPPAQHQHSTVKAGGGHASHHLYVTLVNAGDACVIEPSVTCDHCGFCKSHGH